MGRTNWFDIDGAPRDGSRIELFIPYDPAKFTEDECIDQGHWEPVDINDQFVPEWVKKDGGCFRFDGDDGSYDIQPTRWRPIAS